MHTSDRQEQETYGGTTQQPNTRSWEEAICFLEQLYFGSASQKERRLLSEAKGAHCVQCAM